MLVLLYSKRKTDMGLLSTGRDPEENPITPRSGNDFLTIHYIDCRLGNLLPVGFQKYSPALLINLHRNLITSGNIRRAQRIYDGNKINSIPQLESQGIHITPYTPRKGIVNNSRNSQVVPAHNLPSRIYPRIKIAYSGSHRPISDRNGPPEQILPSLCNRVDRTLYRPFPYP